MANSPPPQESLGERRLAAIMFTDVVSFSARVQENESLTLRLVRRDFKAITAACQTCGGQVLKTTGDGLLMSFPTAGAAVDCALKVQALITRAGKTLPPEQVLEHRIGIHLGDVFIADNDVMGNDVNIAARVLSEAGGGEICVSQTVYDVVKHRLTVKGIYIGERALKNIRDPVSIFKLPTGATKPAPPPAPPAPPRSKLLPAVIGIGLVLAISSFAVWKLIIEPSRNTPAVLAPIPIAQAPTIATRPATTSALLPGTAKLMQVGQGGLANSAKRFGGLGGLIVIEEQQLQPLRPFSIPLESGAGSAELTIVDGMVFRPPNQARGILPANHVRGSTRGVTAIVSDTQIKLRLVFLDTKPRRVTLVAWDYLANANNPNEPLRTESIYVNNASSGQLITQTQLSNFRENGGFVVFEISGAVDLVIKPEKGAGALVQGVFIDVAK